MKNLSKEEFIAAAVGIAAYYGRVASAGEPTAEGVMGAIGAVIQMDAFPGSPGIQQPAYEVAVAQYKQRLVDEEYAAVPKKMRLFRRSPEGKEV